MRDLLSMVRLAFDGCQSSPRAGEGGTVKTARLTSCFCMASIRDFMESAADYNRFHLLTLTNATQAELADMESRRGAGHSLLKKDDTPARLITRTMMEAHAIRANADKLAAILKAGGMESRRAVINGVLLACRHALTDGGEMDAEGMRRAECIAKAAENKAQEDSRPQWEELQDWILDAPCSTYPRKMNVRQCAREVFMDGDLSISAKDALISFGIEPDIVNSRAMDGRAGQWALFIRHNSPAFKRIFAGSSWHGGHGLFTAIKGAPHAGERKCARHGKNVTRWLVIYAPAIMETDS